MNPLWNKKKPPKNSVDFFLFLISSHSNRKYHNLVISRKFSSSRELEPTITVSRFNDAAKLADQSIPIKNRNPD